MDKVPLSEKLLEFVILQLPDNQVNSPYDATVISLRFVIKVTTLPQIITCLVCWGVSIEEQDVVEAGIHMPDPRATLLDIILNHTQIICEDSYQSCINVACCEAIKLKKRNCVLAFMRHGSTPPLEQLRGIPGIFNEPLVHKYVQVMESVQSSIGKEEDTIHEDDEDEKMKVCPFYTF